MTWPIGSTAYEIAQAGRNQAFPTTAASSPGPKLIG